MASIGERAPRLDQLAVGTGGRRRLEALLDVVDREDEGRAAEHRCRTDGDRLERRRPLERGAEVAAEPAEQLALPRLLALALLLDELCLELRVLLRAADDDPAEEAGHDAEADEVGDPNGQRVEARLVQPVAREHDREVHAGHDDRGPHRGAEAEPQRGTEDDEPVQEIEVGRVHRDVDRDRDRGHLDDRADDPDLARREAAQEPEDEDAPGGDHAEDGEKDLDARHRRRDDEQDGGRQRHHPQPNPGELALLGAHPSLELALELMRTIGPGFHDQHCTLASGVRLPYTRRAPERQRATRRCPGASTGGPGARAIHPTREDDDEPDPPDPCHSRRRARRCDGRAARSPPRSRGQRGADRGARARRAAGTRSAAGSRSRCRSRTRASRRAATSSPRPRSGRCAASSRCPRAPARS